MATLHLQITLNYDIYFSEVSASLLKLGRDVEKNPDVYEIIKKLEEEYEKRKEESRFLIFVKNKSLC